MIALPASRAGGRLYWPVTILFCIALAWAILPTGFNFGGGGVHDQIAASPGSWVRRLQWLPLFLLGAYIVWIRRDVARATARHINPFLPAFLLWSAATMLWSPSPQITLRKVVLFAGVGVIGLALQLASWDRDRTLRLMRGVITALLAVSVAMVVLWPAVALNGPPEYDWVGAASSKNNLGQVAGSGLLLWLNVLAARDQSARLALPAAVFAAAILLLTGSATSLAATLALIPLVWFMQRPALTIRHGAVGVLLLAVVAAASALFLYLVCHGVPGWRDFVRPLAHLLGRDVTLTGRLEIWHGVVIEAGKHAWLGYGFGAFWLGVGGPAPWLTQHLYGILWQAHNGYLDLLNETGVVGLGLALGFLVWHIVQTLRLGRCDRANAAGYLALMGFVMLQNVTESSLFRPVNFLFFISVIVSLGVSRAHADIAVERHARTRAPRWTGSAA